MKIKPGLKPWTKKSNIKRKKNYFKSLANSKIVQTKTNKTMPIYVRNFGQNRQISIFRRSGTAYKSNRSFQEIQTGATRVLT